jgi:hypothetical protein
VFEWHEDGLDIQGEQIGRIYFWKFFFKKKVARAEDRTRDLLISFIFSFHHFTAESHRLPTFGGFLKNYRSRSIFFGDDFSRPKLYNNFDKNVLGYILGDYFTNSSGHPA